MQNFLKNAAASLLFLALTAGASTAHAQNRIGGAVQQGQGAYVQKATGTTCISNTLLGVAGISCLPMTQTKFLITPSGNAMSVWQGTVPEGARPAQRTVKNSTLTETLNDGVARTYNTEAVTMPDGSIKLTLTDKQNGNGNAAGSGKGNGRGKGKR